MKISDPRYYIKGEGLELVQECATCPKKFRAKHGVVFPGLGKEGSVRMFLICENRCYLNALPPEACWRA